MPSQLLNVAEAGVVDLDHEAHADRGVDVLQLRHCSVLFLRLSSGLSYRSGLSNHSPRVGAYPSPFPVQQELVLESAAASGGNRRWASASTSSLPAAAFGGPPPDAPPTAAAGPNRRRLRGSSARATTTWPASSALEASVQGVLPPETSTTPGSAAGSASTAAARLGTASVADRASAGVRRRSARGDAVDAGRWAEHGRGCMATVEGGRPDRRRTQSWVGGRPVRRRGAERHAGGRRRPLKRGETPADPPRSARDPRPDRPGRSGRAPTTRAPAADDPVRWAGGDGGSAAGIRWIGTTRSRLGGSGISGAGRTTRVGAGVPGPGRADDRWIDVLRPAPSGSGTDATAAGAGLIATGANRVDGGEGGVVATGSVATAAGVTGASRLPRPRAGWASLGEPWGRRPRERAADSASTGWSAAELAGSSAAVASVASIGSMAPGPAAGSGPDVAAPRARSGGTGEDAAGETPRWIGISVKPRGRAGTRPLVAVPGRCRPRQRGSGTAGRSPGRDGEGRAETQRCGRRASTTGVADGRMRGSAPAACPRCVARAGTPADGRRRR